VGTAFADELFGGAIMDRRTFLAGSIVSAAAASLPLGAAHAAQEQTPAAAGVPSEFYEIRRYRIQSGPQRKLADDYFRDALIPALNRLGIKPVGVFSSSIGEDPSFFVLLPGARAELLVSVEHRLAADAEYQKAGAAFLDAPARDPGFVRMESSLLSALPALPKMTPMPTTGPRLFELRTYESTTDQDHRRKVEMMGAGETAIFKKAGLRPIFMGDTLIGPRQPCLTYLLGFATLADREKGWIAFANAPEWKVLNADPRYSFEPLVSSVNNQILAPTASSQI
jgi:hypothetical protein